MNIQQPVTNTPEDAARFSGLTFGFIGLGLIGGSIARAIRRYVPEATIIAFNPSRDTLEEAIADGVVNTGHCSEDTAEGKPFNAEAFETCDVVFLCAPVQKNAENLAALKGHLKEGSILTDIGSTKRDIHLHVRENGLAPHFIGGHPMTGSERTRYRNSKAQLLENAYYIIAPEPEVPSENTERFVALVRLLRALPIVVSCDEHDYAVAAISHVPHVISASLVNLVRDSDSPDGLMKMIAAGGFKDITRISSSSPVMWQQICLTNGDNIVKLLDDYIASLQKVREEIKDSGADALYQFFDSARTYRDSFTGSGRGAVAPQYSFHVDIADRPAALAEVVTLLAVNAISIKNIGITHNREYQEGVLLVEFHSQKDLAFAEEILTAHNYSLHE